MRILLLIVFLLFVSDGPRKDSLKTDTIPPAEVLLKQQRAKGIERKLDNTLAELDSIMTVLNNDSIRRK